MQLFEFKDILRADGDGIHTPIVHFERGSQRVVFIGVLHYGLRTYFAAIQKILDGHHTREYAVLHESAEDLYVPRASMEVSELELKSHQRTRELFKNFGDMHGVDYQGNCLCIREGWVNADISATEIAEYFYGNRKVFSKAEVEDLLQKIERLSAREVVSKVMRASYDGNIATMINGYQHSISVRDDCAARCILKYVLHQPVATYWGSYHLIGIGNRLLEEGFVITEIDWLCALPASID